LSLIDEDIKKQAAQAPQQAQDYLRDFFNALKEDRKSLFMQSFIRSFFFIALAALLVWLQIRKKIQSWVLIGSLGFLAFIDIMVVDSKYLNEDHFTDKEEYNQTFFTPSAADEQIKKDTGYYRVFDRRQRQGTGGAMTSYFHNSVEGYHAAKLSIYQDLIEHQLNKLQSITLLNMLNTKYILQSNEKGEDVFSLNDQNLGPAWFVNSIRFENTPKAVMDALTTFNPKDTAIVFAKDKSLINFDSSSSDTTGSIQLVSNLNDLIHYTSNSNTQKFAVFSEVYYDKGWKAYIDDKETPIIRTNYVLRGLVIPAGKHNIRFEFHPESFYTGKSIAQVVAIVIWLLLLAAIANEFRKRKKVEVKKVETKQSEVHKK
ncbi:MAG: YfhO family protein, partial [Flavisolibacter sp.]